MENDRRDFLRKSALLGLAGLASNVFGSKQEAVTSALEHLGGGDKITLPALPYAYDALEPFIDKETMTIHHTKHHQAYIDKLNTVSSKEFDNKLSLTESCSKVNDQTAPLLRNNLGGHYNHQLFWQLMRPSPGKTNEPSGVLADAIKKEMKSFDKFKTSFSEAAAKHFGSGWCWLIKDSGGKLKITSTPNQDNPLMQVAADKGSIVLGLDVWEHAYYLKYQNKRAEYIENWWRVVNWEKATTLYSGQ